VVVIYLIGRDWFREDAAGPAGEERS